MFNHKLDVIRQIHSKAYFWDDIQSETDIDIDEEVWKKMIDRSTYWITSTVTLLMKYSTNFPDDET